MSGTCAWLLAPDRAAKVSLVFDGTWEALGYFFRASLKLPVCLQESARYTNQVRQNSGVFLGLCHKFCTSHILVSLQVASKRLSGHLGSTKLFVHKGKTNPRIWSVLTLYNWHFLVSELVTLIGTLKLPMCPRTQNSPWQLCQVREVEHKCENYYDWKMARQRAKNADFQCTKEWDYCVNALPIPGT